MKNYQRSNKTSDHGSWEMFLQKTEVQQPTRKDFGSPRGFENAKSIRTVVPNSVPEYERKESIKITQKRQQDEGLHPGRMGTLIAHTGDDHEKYEAKRKQKENAFQPKTVDSSIQNRRTLKTCTLKNYDYQSSVMCLPSAIERRLPNEEHIYQEPRAYEAGNISQKKKMEYDFKSAEDRHTSYQVRLGSAPTNTEKLNRVRSMDIKDVFASSIPPPAEPINPMTKGVKLVNPGQSIYKQSHDESEFNISKKGKPRNQQPFQDAFKSNFRFI